MIVKIPKFRNQKSLKLGDRIARISATKWPNSRRQFHFMKKNRRLFCHEIHTGER